MTKMRKVGTCTWDHTEGRTLSQNQVSLGALWAPRLPWLGAEEAVFREAQEEP